MEILFKDILFVYTGMQVAKIRSMHLTLCVAIFLLNLAYNDKQTDGQQQFDRWTEIKRSTCNLKLIIFSAVTLALVTSTLFYQVRPNLDTRQRNFAVLRTLH